MADRWAEFEEHFSRLWQREESLRQAHRAMTQRTAEVVREIADARRRIARLYDARAEGAGEQAVYLRARARRFDEVADRAARFAEAEEEEASRE